MLTINSVSLNEKKLEFNYDGSDKNGALEIILDKEYQSNEDITLKIDYHTNHENKSDPNNIWGSFGKGIRFIEPTSTGPLKRKQIWSSGEPLSNRYWFPGNDNLKDIRTTEFTATVENPLMVISNGQLVQTKNNNDGTRTFHYKTDKPYPNYLTSFAIGEYTDVKQKINDIQIHTYGYPDERNAIEATVELLPDMVKFISEKTGFNYPYAEYSQVVVQDYPFPGLNGQNTAVTISDNYIDDDRTHADFLYLWDGVALQALAGQWFGNLIMPESWEHIWLNQSFTQYFAGLYTGHINGHDEYLTYYYPFEKGAVIGDWNSGYRHPVVTKSFSDVGSFTSDNYAKFRGALVLRMLSKELGDENWSKAIKHYVKMNAGRQVTTESFIKAIEESTGESMEWFFDQWIYKTGLPFFGVTKKYDADNKELTIIVSQTQKTDTAAEYPQVELFKGKIEIGIDDKIEQVFIEPSSENRFTFSLQEEPKLINFDFESTWIKELKFEKSFTELLYQLKNDKDVLGRWSAIDELVKIAKNEKTSASDKKLICDAFRKTVRSNSYWRLRSYALSQLRSISALPYDETNIDLLLKIIAEDSAWVKTSAIFFLGMTKDEKYADVYINAFDDKSDRVINAAASALGKSKSPKAFDALIKLAEKPSWKSQSLISALNGLKELGDERGVGFALKTIANAKLPRWWLATSVWDYPLAAAETLVSFGKGNLAYPVIYERFRKSIDENDYNDIFSNLLLITTLADPRGQEAFDLLKEKFKDDSNAMIAVNQYEAQFKDIIKN
ncbi:MAG: HEAT repeat domain-containing protein [Ignavibacteria bacterium]|nr:HEAT repeat domain-containing protein [Ignavibacteria bacterium]